MCLWLLHNQQIVKPPQKEVLFFRGFVPVSSLQFGVVADDADDIDRRKRLAHHREEFEADGHEGALAGLAALFLFP